MRSLAVVIGLLLSALTSVVCAQPPEAPFDSDAFNRLAPNERFSFVVARLQEREARLANFSYTLREESHNVNLDTGAIEHPSVGKDRYSVRRLGDSLWMHLFEMEKDGRETDFTTNWDGKRAICLTRYPGAKSPSASIIDYENSNFEYRSYNEILGIRVRNATRKPQTLVTWLNWARDHKGPFTVEVTADQRDARHLIRITETEGYRDPDANIPAFHETLFWLDPDRGFMPCRREYQYVAHGTRSNHEFTEVKDARQIDGFWVPMKTFRRTGTIAARSETELTYTVDEFKLGAVTAKQVRVDLPVGTEVLDTIKKKAYRVLHNGETELLPLYDEATGTLLRPGPDGKYIPTTPGQKSAPDTLKSDSGK
jgi:hypothetical protein